jgi:hypothetical protein
MKKGQSLVEYAVIVSLAIYFFVCIIRVLHAASSACSAYHFDVIFLLQIWQKFPC